MGKENFESKIQRITGEFDRLPPPQVWQDIEQKISLGSNISPIWKRPEWIFPLGLVATFLVVVVLFWFPPKSEPVWFDNFWDALLVAEQENKPLLVLFTRTCPDCEKLDNILVQSDLDDLNNKFVPVRLLLDDQTPMDGAPPVIQLFADKNIELVHLQEYGQSALRVVEQDIILKTWGRVWEFWLQDDFHSTSAPVLVLLTPEKERIAQFDYVLNTEFSAAEMSQEIERWLKLHLNFYAQNQLEGQQMFTALCASCHHQNMKDPLTGPALGNIRKKWGDYPEKDLYNFIRNSQKMIIESHPLALATWNKWKPVIMTNFPNLSDLELKKIIDYIDWKYARN